MGKNSLEGGGAFVAGKVDDEFIDNVAKIENERGEQNRILYRQNIARLRVELEILRKLLLENPEMMEKYGENALSKSKKFSPLRKAFLVGGIDALFEKWQESRLSQPIEEQEVAGAMTDIRRELVGYLNLNAKEEFIQRFGDVESWGFQYKQDAKHYIVNEQDPQIMRMRELIAEYGMEKKEVEEEMSESKAVQEPGTEDGLVSRFLSWLKR